jgi:hypothetical protein
MQFAIDFLKVDSQISHALRLCSVFDPQGAIATLKIIENEAQTGDLLFQRKIIQSSWDKFQWMRKIPLIKYLGHQIPAMILKKFTTDTALVFSEGSIAPSPQDFYYLYDLKSTYFLRAIKQHPAARMAVSSQSLKELCGLDPQVRVIPPPIPTEDFPFVDLVVLKKSITILLPKGGAQDVSWVKNFWPSQEVLILGDCDLKTLPIQANIKHQPKFCHGTIQAAFMESFLVFDFLSAGPLPTYGLLALANQCVVAAQSNPALHEFLPLSATFSFAKHPMEIVETIPLIQQVFLATDWAEMRRYALRFNEKNFKQKMEKWILP